MSASLKKNYHRNTGNTLCAVAVIIFAVLTLFPFYWMVRSSLMSNLEINMYPPHMIPHAWHFENYPVALSTFPFFTYMLNTLKIALPAVVGTLLTSTLAAYAFSRIEFPGRKFWFVLVIGSMLMPGTVTIIPIFMAWSRLGFADSYVPLIVPAFLGGGGFNIFLIRQFMMTIPHDLDEAAYIDGARHDQILFQVILPLIKPVLISVGLFAFITYWNDLLGPLIYVSTNSKNTISQGLANFMSGFGTDWKAVMALSCMAITPSVVLYFFGQKYFIEGIVLSGMKS